MVEKFSKGFKEFLVKSFVFVVLFITIQLLTMGIVSKTTLPGDLKLFAMDDLAEATLFMLVLFIGLSRKKILEIKEKLLKGRINFKSELEILLPVSHHMILKDFKQLLIKEIDKHL